MNYTFPVINTIDDVLPHIEGRKEFIVAHREGFDVINYVVAMKETFDMTGPNDLGGAIRRECRGLIFYPDGRIMSRPFHKFFNFGEREETQIENIDLSQAHTIVEKMDGSMIRPLIIGDELHLGTKMGLTDIAREAQDWLRGRSSVAEEWIRDYVDRGYTPIFEWISPSNKIVVDYDGESKLVLLALRNTVTGVYGWPSINVFETPKFYGSDIVDLGALIDARRSDQGREGFILQFADGHVGKAKTDWYIRIHKTKDAIQLDRNIIALILHEEIDDIMPMLDKSDRNRVRDLESRFWRGFNSTFDHIEDVYQTCKDQDKKSVALNVVPTLRYKQYARLLFSMMDGKDLRTMMLAAALQHTSNTSKYDDLANWMDIN